MTRFCLSLVGIFLWSSVYATPASLNPKVIMKSIEAVKTAEKRDEIYLAITAYPSEGRPSHTQIPKFPMYWPSTHLDKAKNIEVWSQPLKTGEAVTLIVAIIDKDVQPWNTDDLIGEVKLHLMNKNGKLVTEWNVPNRDELTTAASTQQDSKGLFEFRMHKAHYKVQFAVQ